MHAGPDFWLKILVRFVVRDCCTYTQFNTYKQLRNITLCNITHIFDKILMTPPHYFSLF
jgi:hypothetical protein